MPLKDIWGDMQGPEESRVAGLAGDDVTKELSPWEVLKQKNDGPPTYPHCGVHGHT